MHLFDPDTSHTGQAGTTQLKALRSVVELSHHLQAESTGK